MCDICVVIAKLYHICINNLHFYYFRGSTSAKTTIRTTVATAWLRQC